MRTVLFLCFTAIASGAQTADYEYQNGYPMPGPSVMAGLSIRL